MQYGSPGDVQSKWFTFAGVKMRLCATYPLVEQWEKHMADLGALRPVEGKPLEPAPARDHAAIFRAHREALIGLLCGVEVEGDNLPPRWTPETVTASVLSSGPLQTIITDFAGWLFRESAAFCDDGPGEAA